MGETSSLDKLTRAYDRMMERVKVRLDELEKLERNALPMVQRSIEHAAEKAVELGELTREEARLIGGYLKRDLADAGQHLAETGHDLSGWLRFDLELMEDRLFDLFSRAADKTRLEIMAFTEAVQQESHYQSGEITGPGTLQCDACGELIHFHATAPIPVCPRCQALTFSRATEGES